MKSEVIVLDRGIFLRERSRDGAKLLLSLITAI